jgi:methionyl-tRNA synthetase
MSKSKLNQTFPTDLVNGNDELGFAAFGVDGFRYHFLRDTPFGPDGDFSHEGIVTRRASGTARTAPVGTSQDPTNAGE